MTVAEEGEQQTIGESEKIYFIAQLARLVKGERNSKSMAKAAIDFFDKHKK